MLGICAGMQIMARLGSNDTLVQKANSEMHSEKTHHISIPKDTLLYEILGEQNILINSFHNNCISSSGLNRISATCAEDGVIEAIENDTVNFFLGVQWHPEKTFDTDKNSQKIFKYLIGQANKRKM